MSARPSSALVLAGVALAAFTVWITRQAKTLEQDLDANSTKISLLDKPAPDFRLTALDGRAISLADYHGKKKLLLVFWAPWNNASHPQMLMATMLQKAKPDPDFEILAISVDDDPAATRKFVNDAKISFPVVMDANRALADSYRVRVVPTTILIDTDGKVVYGGTYQRGQNELAQRLGVNPGDMRMNFGGRNGGRGN